MTSEATADFVIKGDVLKVDENLGVVFGFAVVCTQDGEPYFDTQGDHIPEESMVEASLDFMKYSREVRDSHGNDADDGLIAFAFPLTKDIAKALGIETQKTGLLVGMRPSDDLLEKYTSGEYTGFSIGGRRITDEIVSD